MSAKKNKALVERYLQLTLSGELDELAEVLHPRAKGFDGEDQVTGVAKFRAYFEGVRSGLTKSRFKAQVVACEGEWVAVCGTTSATHSGPLMGLPPSGKKVSIPGAAFFRVVDGKIVEVRSFWDIAAFFKQAALPPEHIGALQRKP